MARSFFALAACLCLCLSPTAWSATPGGESAPAIKIGDAVGPLSFKDIRFVQHSLKDLGEYKACVLVFTTLDCPVVKRYLPTLKELDEAYRERGVQFVAVNVGPDDPLIEVAYQAVKADISFPFVKDFEGNTVKALGVKRVPEVAIVDAEGKLRYRGRIDNQYRVSGVQPNVGAEPLKDALNALLSGAEVAVTETPVDGCLITQAKPPKLEGVTFAEHIAPIMQKHCQECHHPGATGPMSLISYDDVSGNAEMVAEVVGEQRMPPNYSSREQAHEIVNRQVLTDDERNQVLAWCAGDKPLGDPAKMPAPREFADSKWLIGEPDLVVAMSAEAKIPEKGIIPYKYAFLPYKFEEDTWVNNVQILPGNAAVVHHCNLAAIQPGGKYNDAEFITGFVPGGSPMNLEPGQGFLIKKGSVLVLQIHYVTTGEKTTDRTSVGFKFCKGKVKKQLHHFRVTTSDIAIAPFASHHPVSSKRVLKTDAVGVGMFSHMHLRGKDMTFFARYPDGTSETILAIPNYDFNWQMAYRWETGKKKFPAGTEIEVVAHYDNSKFNPYNPDPSDTVREGDQTYEEMMFGFFFYTEDGPDLDLEVDGSNGQAIKKDEPVASAQASAN